MGRMKLIIANAMLAIALMGCSAPSQAAPAPTVTVTAPATSVAVDNADSRFDTFFVSKYKESLGRMPSNEEVQAAREVGRSTCAALEAGATGNQVAAVLIKGQTDPKVITVILIAAGTGVGIYCPDHIKDFG